MICPGLGGYTVVTGRYVWLRLLKYDIPRFYVCCATTFGAVPLRLPVQRSHVGYLRLMLVDSRLQPVYIRTDVVGCSVRRPHAFAVLRLPVVTTLHVG